MLKYCHALAVMICLSLPGFAQSKEDARPLEPGRSAEREIASGQTHVYQITLTAGQFLRVTIEPKGVDAALALIAPDGKPVVEANLTGADRRESLSAEAPESGEYRLTIRAGGSGRTTGSYRINPELRAMATPEDKQRIAAERLLNEAYALSRQGNPAAGRVVEVAEQSLTLWRGLNDRFWEAYTLELMGNASNAMTSHEKAVEFLGQALAITRELKDREREPITLNNLGYSYNFLDHYEKAIECYEQALVIAREDKRRAVEGAALAYLGLSNAALNQYEKAIEYYEQSLAIARELKLVPQEGRMLGNIGIAYQQMGRVQQASQYFEQALAIARETKDRNSEASALNWLGTAHSKLGLNEKAIEYFEQALSIARERRQIPLEGPILNKLGAVYFNLGRQEKAMECVEQALVIARKTKHRDEEAAALHRLARIVRARGDLAGARAYIEDCLKIVELQRTEIYNHESRASYFTEAREYNEFFIDLLMRFDQSTPGQGYDALALEASERARARGLVELLSEAGAGIRQGVDPALLEQERALAKRLNAKAQQLSLRSAQGQTAALNQEISALENEYQQTQAAIRRTSPRYAALTSPQTLRLSEIQQLLDDETLLLEYTLGDERSFLWVVGKGSLAGFELPGRELVEQASRRVYDLLTARSRTLRLETPVERQERIRKADEQLKSAAGELSRMLLSQVAARLDSKRLVIVADGALQYIPFAMLPAPQSLQPLIVDHEIINLPSASTLAVQRRELAGRQPAPKTLAVIADPVFAVSDERMKTVARNASAGKIKTQTDATTASVDYTRTIEHLTEDAPAGPGRKLVIPRLPSTRREADQIAAIASMASGSETLKAVDFKANRAVVSNSDLGQYRYVHFATHGLLDSQRPGLSALVLSLVDEQGRPQDGFLRAHEIYNLNLPAELVVLSACRTGLGKEVKGEGLVGLTRGFMYAGAARVVVSLWSVNDRATAELMAKFYQKMLKEGQRPAAALRLAQVEMQRRAQWQSPYFWAAFTLQGEWR